MTISLNPVPRRAYKPVMANARLTLQFDRQMTSRIPKRLAMLGVLLVVGGFLWGVHFVGIPYQDPTPAQRAYEALHGNISGWLMGIGVCVLLSSAVLAIFRLFFARSRGRTN